MSYTYPHYSTPSSLPSDYALLSRYAAALDMQPDNDHDHDAPDAPNAPDDAHTDDNAADGTRDMQAMQNLGVAAMAGGGMGPLPDYAKLHAAEGECLDLVDHAWIGDGVEGRLLRKYGYDV